MSSNPTPPIEPNFFTVPFERPPPLRHTTVPTHAIIRELDYKLATGELWFYYSRWSRDKEVPSRTRLAQLINEVVAPNYTWDYQDASYPDPTKEYSSLLSLKNERVSYVILKLSDKPWQFCGRGRPITIGKKGLGKEAYFEGHRIFSGWDDKDVGTPFDDDDPPRNGSKLAYFIADAPKAWHGEPQRKYSHPLNIHVDLRQTWNDSVRYLPIIVDPDVRYPGGSG